MLLVLCLCFCQTSYAEENAKNWLFDFYSEGVKAQGVVRSPDAKEIGSFRYRAIGSYDAGQESFRLIIEQSQDGQYGSSDYEKVWIWKRGGDDDFVGQLITVKPGGEKKKAILKLQGKNTFILKSYIGERLWTIQTGILERGTVIDSTVIYTKGMEYDFLLASAIVTKQKVDQDDADNPYNPPENPKNQLDD